jgi:hypothetical protein
MEDLAAPASRKSPPSYHLGEMFGYTTNLRSNTQGRASSSMELDHYADVPNNVAEAIIAKNAKWQINLTAASRTSTLVLWATSTTVRQL